MLTGCVAEFRGPGSHISYDDSPDDYEMDMDHRTRFISGRQGRIILLGDGTEINVGNIHDDDGDVDMEDRGVAEEAEDEDLEEQVQKDVPSTDASTNGDTDRSQREGTPAPSSVTSTSDTEAAAKDEEPRQPATESEPKIMPASDSLDTKTVAEHKEPTK